MTQKNNGKQKNSESPTIGRAGGKNKNGNTPETTKYIVTPIYYSNGLPHIGHFITTTVADVLARYYRKKLGAENVFFTTGLDEHGTTVEQAAKKEGYELNTIQEYVDKHAVEWKKAFDSANISYDYFVRTTNLDHKKYAQDFIRKMVANGDVYKGKYTGKYCNGCEKFLTLSDLNEDGNCPLHRPDQVVEIEEENYFFKLSKYAPKIQELIEKNEIKIVPDNKRAEILARINSGVDDVSISRPKEKVAWGVEFPDDSEQTIYVWAEALLNYLSSLEINEKPDFWNNTTHILGKEINWFHNVIWPAFLLSVDFPLYKESYVHSFLNVAGQKISKSLGNLITPEELYAKYGGDGARYVTLANLPYKNDTDVTWEALDNKYNADLANGLGNTVARLSKLAQNARTKHNIKFSPKSVRDSVWDEGWAHLLTDFKIDQALQIIWKKLADIDKHITENAPWAIENKENLQHVLQYEIDELAEVAVMLEPFIPETSAKIQKLLIAPEAENVGVLFPRI